MMSNPNESNVWIQKTASLVPVVIAVSSEASRMSSWLAALQATEAGKSVYFISQDGWVTEPAELKRIVEYSGDDPQAALWKNYWSSEKRR